jgi:hypothetical protein
MAGRPIEISIEAKEFAELAGRTSKLAPAIKTQLRKELRQAATVAAKKSKAEVMKPPLSRGRGRSTGLRRGIAAGIKVQLASGATGKRVGVFIRSTGAGLDADRKKLVRQWDSDRPFRHPVFGNRERWVSQRGRPYFRTIIRKDQPQIEKAVRAALEEAKKTLT